MLTASILLTALMLPVSCWLLVRSPFNAAAITAVLTWLFAVLPAIYFNATGIIPSYSWRNFTFVGGPLSNGEASLPTLALLCIMAATFTAGAVAAWVTRPRLPTPIAQPHPTSPVATLIMSSLWALAALYFLALAGWDFKLFLLPVAEEVEHRPGYLLTMFSMMPLALAAKFYWSSGRLDHRSLLWIGIAVMAAFSRSQRRDFVTMALFVTGLLLIVGELSVGNRKAQVARPRVPPSSTKTIIGLSLLGAASVLVPLLWYSRVYFTALSKGKLLDPTQIRSFSDLLLGSPATGYPTLALIREYVVDTGTHLLHTPAYLSGAVIPRFLWPDKPMDIDNILEQRYRLIENPSSFWFGELYFSFGILAVAAAFLAGFILFRLAQTANTSSSLLVRTLGVVMFMQSVTFYKNGFSQFAINSFMLCAFLLFAWFFPMARRRASKAVEETRRWDFAPARRTRHGRSPAHAANP